MKKRVLIIGCGITGLSCAKLLSSHGWEVEILGTPNYNKPYLVLNGITCELLQDIWQDPHLWDDAFSLTKHKVIWGEESTMTNINYPAVSIEGTVLEKRLYNQLNHCIHITDNVKKFQASLNPDYLQHLNQKFTWIIDSSGRESQVSEILGKRKRLVFGERHVISTKVRLKSTNKQIGSWMEAVKDGWIFLAPLSQQTALLQVMLPGSPICASTALSQILDQSKLIQAQISSVLHTPKLFNATPSLNLSPYGKGWISIGDAACSFDPICGDGTGYAIRQVFLATGALNGIATGIEYEEALQHFTMRLRKTFCSHLEHCINYYSESFSSILWKDELSRMKNTFQKHKNEIQQEYHFSYQLNGSKIIKT